MDKKKKSHENNSLFISLASGLLPYAQKTFQIQCSFKIQLIVKKNLKTMMWLTNNSGKPLPINILAFCLTEILFELKT